MLKFKSCPRCKGDVLLNQDYYGWYEQCLQCGYLRDMGSIMEVHQQQSEEEKKIKKLSGSRK